MASKKKYFKNYENQLLIESKMPTSVSHKCCCEISYFSSAES